jgi:hypothetical protein
MTIAFTSPLRSACLCTALGLASLSPVAAQTVAATRTPPRPDPLDARAAVPAASYRSALTAREPQRNDAPALGWREANERVERIGGWRAYAREANAPEPAASTPASTSERTPASTSPTAARPPAPAPATPAPPGARGHRH